MIYLRYRKAVIRWYGAFLGCLYLLLISFFVDVYAGVTNLQGDRAAANLYWLFQAAGGVAYVIVAPRFYDSLLGLDFNRAKTVIFGGYAAGVVGVAIFLVINPTSIGAGIALNILLFAMIAYGLVLLAFYYRRIPERALRRAIAAFFWLSVFFFPIFYLDVLVSNAASFAALSALDGLSLPVYFIALSVMSATFALRYLNKPAYSDGETITPFFIEQFGITAREAEIIEKTISGATNREIGDELFISPKTVENHLYSIYQKLEVGNRGQMTRLIRTNT